MKAIFVWLLGILCVFGAEDVRVWENSDGKKLNAQLIDMTEFKVQLRTQTGKYWVPIDSLSENDKEYIKEIDLQSFWGEPDFEPQIEVFKGGKKGHTGDKIKLKVSVEGTKGREYTLVCVWLGPKGNTVAPYKFQSKTITEDGDYYHEIEYAIEPWGNKDQWPRHNYKGYILGAYSKGDFGPKLIFSKANHESYKRFLDPTQYPEIQKILDGIR